MTTVSSDILRPKNVDEYDIRTFQEPAFPSPMSCPPDLAPPHQMSLVELQPRGRDLECPPELPPARQFGALAGIGDGMTHDDVWRTYERLLRRQGDRPATIALYRGCLRGLWRYLDDHGVRWDRVTPEDVGAWLEEGRCEPGKWNAGMPWSDGTRYTYGRVVARAYRLFAERGWIQGRNPLEDWKPPPEPTSRRRALPVSAIGLLVNALADDRRLTMMVALQFHQGLRIGEVCRLSVGDIDLHAEVPQIYVKGKGGRKEWMDLSPALVPALQAWLVYLAVRRKRSSRKLLPAQTPLIPNYHDPARHLDPKYAAHLLATRMRPEVGDSGHALRHSGATQLARLTKDPYLVQQFLRHASLDMQAFYVATNAGLLAEALAQLPDPLHPPSAAPGA